MNMLSRPLRTLRSMRSKNGAPHQSTTGVASSSSSQPLARGDSTRAAACPGSIAPIATATSGAVSATASLKRRLMSSSSGLRSGPAAASFGSSAMPQMRQAPGFVSTTSGSIGQTQSAVVPPAAIADALGPFASQCAGSAAKRSRQRGPQKK